MSQVKGGVHGNVDAFISRWSGREGGRERSNYALFLSELCDVIGVARPEPAEASNDSNDYVFERRVEHGWIDLYKKECFILEAKQSRQKGGRKALPEGQGDLFQSQRPSSRKVHSGSFDHLMINARRQAEDYARALPDKHPYPPFILTCDVGRFIEVYADFSGNGRHYAPYPNALGFRIALEELQKPDICERLRRIWQNPTSLDPAKQTAKVTRQIAGELAEISKALEGRGFDPRTVALFLMRCLFTMFVEDVQLIRKDSFKELLKQCVLNPKRFPFEMDDLWKHMDRGDYSPAIGERLLRFNGKLFKKAKALPLTESEIQLLLQAASADWRDLEPAIFGSLFEQAIVPAERKRLGIHYTPRVYVERLVNATIMEPLNEDWSAAQAAVERALRNGSRTAAIREIEDFLKELTKVRVLDPACGTGNFLYVALRQMKQLEGEVVKQLQDLAGEKAVARLYETSVKPEQFFGTDANGRAVEIAELVLWIGYLQWHLQTREGPPAEPVLGDKDHIQEKDAVLTWDGYPERQLQRGRLGRPATRKSVNGEQREVYSYPNARRPEWEAADFIVGNPPFIGGKDIRSRLGDEYTRALWMANPQINQSADYVMYWWDRAAELLTAEGTRLRRFGLVTTNSITQVFQRRVVDRYLSSDRALSLVMAIPDHPWTKASKDSAAVRIAMTVASAGERDGTVKEIIQEGALDTDEPQIQFREITGRINSDLTIGADITRTKALVANEALCSPGVKLHGEGFIITRSQAMQFGLGRRPDLGAHIREYRNGRDLAAHPRGVLVIDLFGLTAEQARTQFPEVYQHLLESVKPTREHNKRASYRDNWWVFGEPRRELRPAIAQLPRYIATIETAKHRIFQFVESAIMPDNMLVVIATDDPFHLGVLSSRLHVVWSFRAGGWLGVGNDPRYSKSRCFDPFPFPDASERDKDKIRSLAEELDRVRKLVLSEHQDLTLTILYNILEKLNKGDKLTTKEDDIKARGQVLIIRDLHEQIDVHVFRTYGWVQSLTDEQIIAQLVSLNLQRSAEEKRGFIRWLRPAYQINQLGALAHRVDRVQTISAHIKSTSRTKFPTEPKDQAARILRFLRTGRSPLTAGEIASSFMDGEQVVGDVQDILKSLHRLGEAKSFDSGKTYFASAR